MFEVDDYQGLAKPELYARLGAQARALFEGEPDPIANAANAAALIWRALPTINWAGFYVLRDGELVLGPFQGKPACVRIAVGRGVCGTAAAQRVTQRVDDVHAFPGHIACDADSRSEIVVPILAGARLWGVLDIDSPEPARFDAEDEAGLEALVRSFVAASTLGQGTQA
jgi:GAF domain-containing protein